MRAVISSAYLSRKSVPEIWPIEFRCFSILYFSSIIIFYFFIKIDRKTVIKIIFCSFLKEIDIYFQEFDLVSSAYLVSSNLFNILYHNSSVILILFLLLLNEYVLPITLLQLLHSYTVNVNNFCVCGFYISPF